MPFEIAVQRHPEHTPEDPRLSAGLVEEAREFRAEQLHRQESTDRHAALVSR